MTSRQRIFWIVFFLAFIVLAILCARSSMGQQQMFLSTKVAAAAPSWTPASVTPEGSQPAVGWWKADAAAYQDDAGSDPATNGSVVANWKDQSGGVAPDVLSTVSRPTYVASSQGSLPTIQFGSAHWLTNAWVLSGSNTIFAVCYVTNNANYRYILSGGDDAQMVYYDNVDKITLRDISTVTLQVGPQDAFEVLTAVFNVGTATSLCRTNGVLMGAGNSGAATLSKLTFGARGTLATPLAGCISEVVWYHAVLSTNDMVTVETYLKNRYGL